MLLICQLHVSTLVIRVTYEHIATEGKPWNHHAKRFISGTFTLSPFLPAFFLQLISYYDFSWAGRHTDSKWHVSQIVPGQSKQWDLDLHPGSDRSLIIGKIAYCSFKTKTWILVVKTWKKCRKKADYPRVSVWIWMAMEPLWDIQLMKQYIKIGSSEATCTQARTHSVRCVSLCVETQTRTRSLGVTQ